VSALLVLRRKCDINVYAKDVASTLQRRGQHGVPASLTENSMALFFRGRMTSDRQKDAAELLMPRAHAVVCTGNSDSDVVVRSACDMMLPVR
jgi:hypothetical protein